MRRSRKVGTGCERLVKSDWGDVWRRMSVHTIDADDGSYPILKMYLSVVDVLFVRMGAFFAAASPDYSAS